MKTSAALTSAEIRCLEQHGILETIRMVMIRTGLGVIKSKNKVHAFIARKNLVSGQGLP